MLKTMLSMRDRMKDRIGIYSAGFNPESVLGLLLPFVVVGMLTVIGYMLVKVLNP